jgi:hypothetical protein
LYLGFAEISIVCIFFLNARPAKIPPKNQEVREANFAKYFPPNPQHFAKFRSRSAFAFLHTTSILKDCVVCRAFSRTSASAEAPRFAWWRFSARGTLVDILSCF